MSIRRDTVIWTPRRAPLREMEQVLAAACPPAWRRTSALITPLFHASPKYRHTTPSAMRLRIITLENGDYQQIHNPDDSNFDEIFTEWPRLIVHYTLPGPDGQAREAILECNDQETDWEKAGWTTGTTVLPVGERKDRHRFLLGFFPWGWPGALAFEAGLASGAAALADLMDGAWEWAQGPAGRSSSVIEENFKPRPTSPEPFENPLDGAPNMDMPDVGRVY